MPRDLDAVAAAIDALRPGVDAHITPERMRRYLSRIADQPAPSTAASAMRLPVLRGLFEEDGLSGLLQFREDFGGGGSAVLLTGGTRTAARPGVAKSEMAKPLWYFAHLDTISYLVQPEEEGRYPLVPFCYHMIEAGKRDARAYRYDLRSDAYAIIAEGELETVAGRAFFRADPRGAALRPGDRIVPVVSYREVDEAGTFVGHVDNAGGVAALALAAPVLAEARIEAMIAFPDEEEGPRGEGNQMMARGSARIVNGLPAPDLAIVADVQQAGGGAEADTHGGVQNSTRLGGGAVLAEFSSFGRGAVTPPHLYALAHHLAGVISACGVAVQESNNAYTSRSDEVSLVLRTPNILQLGFPGFNRHFDRGEPRANLNDVVALSKTLVYMSALRTAAAGRTPRHPGGSAWSIS